ncbi:MAG: WD40/YVTN/BNR-like repeat-containing protein [Candidatus Thorarchaeota archaeon]
MIALNGISRLISLKAHLVLILVCMPSIMLILSTTSEIMYEPLQVSETTWDLLESDYPDAFFEDVSFLNSTHGWITGEATGFAFSSDVVVLHTEDGGDSWKLQFNRSSQLITTIDVVDEQIVWTNGLRNLFYTLDGGKTWNESVVVDGLMGGLTTVKFINKTHGWTAHGYTLYRTKNNGQSWESVPGWNVSDNPRMMLPLSLQNIWASGFAGIYHSMDGAVTWEKVSSRGGWSLSFVSETEGWTVDDNRLAHTVDGNTWVELTIPGRLPFTGLRFDPPYLTDLEFLDEANGWIVGREIPVMYTPDSGANWYEQSVPDEISSRITAIDFINRTHGWAVGGNGIIIRTITGDSLGNRLWNGMTDPLFLSIIAVVVAVPVGIFIIRRYRRGKRPISDSKPPQPKIDW